MSTLHEHYHSSHIVCTICEASPHVIESGSPIAFRDTREYVEHMQSYHNSSHSSNNNNQKITFRIGNTYHSQYNQNAKSSSNSSSNSSYNYNNNSRVLPYVDLQMGSANPYNSNNNNNNTISMVEHNRHNETTTTSRGIDRDNNIIYRRDQGSAPILQNQIIPSHMRIAGKVSGTI